jgi:hypothetical protein
LNNKKIAIIGKGTAGSISAIYLKNRLPLEIDWYFDPSTPEQAVGEGSTLAFPNFLFHNTNFLYSDVEQYLGGTYKNSIRKINYKGSGDYHHSFSLGNSGLHFNANGFQQFTQNYLQNQIRIIPKQITSYDQVDATHILDCSGKPTNFENYNQVSGISVNSAHIVQCGWEKPEFNYTLTIARPYGWVFGIPLQGRCSIGYLYNKNINTLEEVKEDIKEVFKQFNLTPSDKTKSFNFANYYKKENFTDRVTYNGNSSFFLEPLEATSIETMFKVLNSLEGVLLGQITRQEAQLKYLSFIKNTEQMIAMHYFAGSKFKTPFWDYAFNNSLPIVQKMTSNPKFRALFNEIESINNGNKFVNTSNETFGTWGAFSFYQNMHNLGIYNQIKDLIQKNNKPNLIF